MNCFCCKTIAIYKSQSYNIKMYDCNCGARIQSRDNTSYKVFILSRYLNKTNFIQWHHIFHKKENKEEKYFAFYMNNYLKLSLPFEITYEEALLKINKLLSLM